MKEKKPKKTWRIALLISVFLLILCGALAAALFTKKESETDYRQMQSASLPVVSLKYSEDFETDLYGYVTEMNLVDMRDVIVPLDENRSLTAEVMLYGNEVSSLSYEVRDLSGETLLDSGQTDTDGSGTESITWDMHFSSLLESGTEYHLVLTLHCSDRDIRYYTRVIYSKTNYTDTLLSFVRTFSEAPYDASTADFIVNYISPSDTSETEDYYYTDLNSKYAMFVFNGLSVERGTDVTYRITELEPTQLSVTLEYTIELETEGEIRNCRVREFFCTRYRSEKVYLLDYYRTVEEEFNESDATQESGRIELGIGSGETQILNSEDDNITAFVENREIWSYNASGNVLNMIFSMKDDTDKTGRSSFDHHEMQIVKVTDDGDIDYMVYGYMNRGDYEGQVGICFYRYTASENATKKLFFMPVTQSEAMLITDLGSLAYVNDDDVCYLRYGDGIYSIDLNTGESVEVSIRAYPGMYAMNEEGNVVAWQEGDDMTYPERLVVLNMDTQTTAVINAEEGQYVKILDFIGDDIVYGFGTRDDSIIQANVDTQQLLSQVVIASTDEKLTVCQTYQADGFRILSAYVSGKQITIERCRRDSSESYTVIDSDYLLLTQPFDSDENRSSLKNRVGDEELKEYYIQLGITTNHDSQLSSVVPRFDVSENVNVILLQHMQTGACYVYGRGRLLAVESEINTAIDEAYASMGVVVDDSLDYLWTRGTRDIAKTLSIQHFTVSDGECSLGAALEVLCAQEGIQLKNVTSLLDLGESPFDIIDDALGEDTALNLYECSLQEVLYFIHQGRPVIAVTGNRTAVVICGYDADGVSIYFPETGTTEYVATADAEQYFGKNKNAFISYK